VDNGIFLVATARTVARTGEDAAAAFRAPVQAIACTSATTILGFGTLYWTHSAAVRSLGLVAALGVAGSLIGSILLLLPLLLRRLGRR
jgi:predicted RND superfamily exporter protein